MTFVNHGCNGTYNVGDYENIEYTEFTVDAKSVPSDMSDRVLLRTYHPIIDRHMGSYLSGGDFALNDIKAGEEILNNYLNFVENEEWTSDVNHLRAQCSGEAVGSVKKYEDEAVG
mmetsp:Transcript_54572/g.163036  ORF Transcript_54572/g.163036 Transcript_54572/m.163036 type:complete len:115 (-) Transcript_54572:364-708(-)